MENRKTFAKATRIQCHFRGRCTKIWYNMCRSMKKYNIVIWALFIVERCVFYVMLPLDWPFAYQRMQNLDVFSLRTDLINSLLNLHAQPPLYNLFIGLVVKIVPETFAPIVVQCIYFLLACLTFFMYRRIAAAIIRSNFIRICCDIAYLLFPTILFSERWFTYAFPVTAMIVALAFLTLKLSRVGPATIRYFTLFSVIAAAVVLMRSFFHLIAWMMPALLCALYATGRVQIRRKCIIAIFSFAVAALPYCWNLSRYDMFTSSTWQGMNLFRTMHYVSTPELEKEVEGGFLHPVCRLRSFAPIRDYIEAFPQTQESCITSQNCKVLDDEEKSSSANDRTGEVNWNHRIIPVASRELEKGWKHLVFKYPSAYALGVLNGLYSFFTVDVYQFWDNSDEWSPAASKSALDFSIRTVKAIVIPVVFILLFISSAVAFFRLMRRKSTCAFALFSLGTMIYVLAISITCELGETSIMRAPIDPLCLLGFFGLIDYIAQARRDEGSCDDSGI